MAVFELNRGEHHDHLVCIECGKVEEFVDASIEERQKAVAGERGFELHDHSMILYGRCATCRTRSGTGRKLHHHG
jgi:Fur family ferric uptake transcriptional regulator